MGTLCFRGLQLKTLAYYSVLSPSNYSIFGAWGSELRIQVTPSLGTSNGLVPASERR